MISTRSSFIACALLMFAAKVVLAASTETVLYSFKGGSDGANPSAGLVADGAGNLYGTTIAGGSGSCAGGCGTVFKLSPQQGGGWTKTTLYSFQGNDGAAPSASLIFDQAGNLYGTTVTGGPHHDGVVYQLSQQGTSWSETVLYSFAGGSDGAYAIASVTFDKQGNLYGTTLFGGGSANGGVVFQLAPPMQTGGAWTETVLHRFGSNGDGIDPMAAVLVDRQGALYGTTSSGIVFKLIPPAPGQNKWKEKVLYQFSGGGNNGSQPCGLLAGKRTGVLYGTTNLGGGPANAGTVFQLTPNPTGFWSESALHSFSGGADGGLACGPLISDPAGNLYGTTSGNGADILGTAFQLAPQSDGTWTETVLHDFAGGQDGFSPAGGVIFGKSSALYGVTGAGGSSGSGTVYQIIP